MHFKFENGPDFGIYLIPRPFSPRLSKSYTHTATVIVDDCAPADSGARPHRQLNSLRPTLSTLACLQTDSDFAGFIVGEVNASLLKSLLYLEDR